jgi:L-2-hydroxycarboxylate dehydrogenase (NAD+)
METQVLTIDAACALAFDILSRYSVSPADATAIARHLVDAEIRGYASHGLVRLPPMIEKIQSARTGGTRQIIVDTGSFLMLAGGGSQGIASVTDLLERAAKRAVENGAVVVGATDYVGTTGCLGVYAASLARRGLTAIQFCHSEYGVAPHGSAKAILGTNPIAVSMPGEEFPFVADFATAAWSYGSLKAAMAGKQRIPLGVVQTADGNPSTDPNDADNGSQLPMAGHKGYALGLAIELICGPLLGGKAGCDAVQGSDSYFAVVLRTNIARPTEVVEKEMELLYEEIRRAPLAAGFDAVRIPGETADAKAVAASEISLSSELAAKLVALRRR